MEEPDVPEDSDSQPVNLEDMIALDEKICAAESLTKWSIRIGPICDGRGSSREDEVA
jgi:hypothetical protein